VPFIGTLVMVTAPPPIGMTPPLGRRPLPACRGILPLPPIIIAMSSPFIVYLLARRRSNSLCRPPRPPPRLTTVA
jgi:hypothetical protein